MSDTDSVDSDVELDVAPLGKFNAQQFMESMGYVPGQGLGADSQGIATPIEVKLRAKKAGLGSDQVPETRSEPSEKPVSARKDQIKHELEGLENALRSIDDLDLVEFYEVFSKYEFWDDLQLWQAVRRKVVLKLRPGINPFSLETVLDLEIAQQCIPRVEYARLLSDHWLPLALQSNTHQLVEFMISRSSIIEPVANKLSLQILPRLVGSSDLLPVLVESLTLLPSFRLTLSRYINELPGITRKNIQLILIFLDDTQNYSALPIQKSASFDELVQTADMFQGTLHYPEVMRAFVLPSWLNSLENTLSQNNLDKLKSELQTLKLRVFEEPLFIAGLQLINAYFDTQRVEAAETPTPQTVLSAVCALKGYQHVSSNEYSGKIIGANNQVLNYLWTNDELFGQINEGQRIPLRIQDIDSLIRPASSLTNQ